MFFGLFVRLAAIITVLTLLGVGAAVGARRTPIDPRFFTALHGTPNPHAIWSPGGRYYTVVTGNAITTAQFIWIIEAATGRTTTSNFFGGRLPQLAGWSVDGRYVAFGSMANYGTSHLVVFDAETWTQPRIDHPCAMFLSAPCEAERPIGMTDDGMGVRLANGGSFRFEDMAYHGP